MKIPLLVANQKGSRSVEKSNDGHNEGKGNWFRGRQMKPKGTCWGCGEKWFRGHEYPARKSRKVPRGRNTINNKTGPAIPARGILLCLREAHDAANHAINVDGTERYYVDSGATGHFINEVDALHDYIPFVTSHSIKTAEDGYIHALGSGTLKLTTTTNGKETKGECKTSIIYLIFTLD